MSAVGALIVRDPSGIDGVYERRAMPLPRRPRRTRYRHTCPDQTRVWVSAQYVAGTDATLYRWLVGGERSTTAVAGRVAGPPSWAVVDAIHAGALPVPPEPQRGDPVDPSDPWFSEPAPVEADPECGCGGGCPWCDPFANAAPVAAATPAAA